MHYGWLAEEHNRLHVVESWPESAHKQAVLRAIRSTIQSLSRSLRLEDLPFCAVCLGRTHGPSLVTVAPVSQIGTTRSNLAA